MMAWRLEGQAIALAWTLAAVACGKGTRGDQTGAADGSGAPSDQEPPVALNGDSPIQYPPRLYDQKVEGDVVLRLVVDSAGRLLSESTKVAESSGYSALDSAALMGARKLRFAPARRRGLAIATAFLQPVEFRHPQASGAVRKGEPDTTRVTPAPPPPTATPIRQQPPPAPARAATPPVAAPARDTIPVKRDTFPRPVDTTRTRPAAPDTAAQKRDSSAVPR